MTRHNGISSRQIKAARALLDWSQEELAESCGLSIATIRKLEAGIISPRDSTSGSIKKAFEEAGIEFLDHNGVRQKPEDISVYNGNEGAIAFFDDVYQTANKLGGDLVVVCISEKPFMQALGDYLEFHLSRMASIAHKSNVKCILMDDLEATPAQYCQYRSISKAYVDSVPFYVYGDNYAIFLFDAKPSPKIVVHRSPLLAGAYRRQFYSMWDKATPLGTPALKTEPHKKK